MTEIVYKATVHVVKCCVHGLVYIHVMVCSKSEPGADGKICLWLLLEISGVVPFVRGSMYVWCLKC